MKKDDEKMSNTYDERIAKLAVTSRILEEIDMGLSNANRTLVDIRDVDFAKIITAGKASQHLGAAILGGGFTYAGAAAALGSSLGVLGIAAAPGFLGLLGFPLLTPIAIIGYFYKKKKDREKREQQERDLLHAEKLALKKIIEKQSQVILALKRAMEELKRKQKEIEKNIANTINYAKEQEERVEYLETLLKMVNMASEAFEVGVA
jgi:hypothetical protein